MANPCILSYSSHKSPNTNRMCHSPSSGHDVRHEHASFCLRVFWLPSKKLSDAFIHGIACKVIDRTTRGTQLTSMFAISVEPAESKIKYARKTEEGDEKKIPNTSYFSFSRLGRSFIWYSVLNIITGSKIAARIINETKSFNAKGFPYLVHCITPNPGKGEDFVGGHSSAFE